MRGLKKLLKRSLRFRRLLRRYRLWKTKSVWARVRNVPRGESAEKARGSATRVLMATSLGGFLPGTFLESILGVALRQREADVHYLLCDGVLPACQECTDQISVSQSEMADEGPSKKLCSPCHKYPGRMLRDLAFPVHKYSDYLSADAMSDIEAICDSVETEQIPVFIWQGLSIGEHALAGALRFFGRGELEKNETCEKVLRRYLRASLMTAFVMLEMLKLHKFDVAVFHHGIYVPQGVIAEVLRKKGVRVVNWNPAFRKKTFIFSHGDTYHRTMMWEPEENWKNLELTQEREKELMHYLKSRRDGSRDWISFQRQPEEDWKAIAARYGIDESKPAIGILTNVLWDARIHYPTSIFPTMLDWLTYTIKQFIRRTDLTVIIRIHPAEITGGNPSHQRVADEIAKAFPDLPKHIHVVGPDDPASTYVIMARCNAAIIYGTKTGVELSTQGIPVIVGGEAWSRNKGFTHDPSTLREYDNLLEQLPFDSALPEASVLRAKKYAYHFFFRRMIPLSFLKLKPGWPLFRLGLQDAGELLPGRSPGLDVICDGILKGTDFIYPQESLA